MDIATLIGIVGGVIVVGWSIVSGAGNDVMSFVDLPSVLLVLGGMMAATFIATPLKSVLGLGAIVKKAFLQKLPSPQTLIEELVSYAEMARRDGILSLEHVTREIKDEFTVKGIQMAIDGTDPEVIEQILKSELDRVADRHVRGKAVLDTMAKYAPAFGMIGTLVGLVIMLGNMQDPSKIGPGMAIALLTTLYGAVVANLICSPLAEKLEKVSADELLLKEIVIRGVMAIQSGDNPRVVEQKLKTYLSPSLRAAMEPREAA